MICDHQEPRDSVAYNDDGMPSDAAAMLEKFHTSEDVLISSFNMTEGAD